MRALTLVLLSSLSACQCLVPVQDDEDAGTSMDASVITDAGSGECTSPSDCTGIGPTTRACDLIGADGGAWSCVQNRCVTQCATYAGRTCTQSNSDCLTCAPATTCAPNDCTRSARFNYRVEDIACSIDAGVTVDTTFRELVGAANCGVPLVIERPNGDDAFGTLYEHDGVIRSARIERMGGVCIVTDLPTGLQRLLFDCPKCQFILVR
ncbi:MAG: hypothetical protein ACO1OB_25460 [Archangium sp.]